MANVDAGSTFQGAGQELPQKRPPPANAFPKGVSGNPSGKRKAARAIVDGLSDGGRMRRVYGQDKEADCNASQRTLRKLLDRDPKGYIQLMTQLERSEGEAAQAAVSVVSGPAELPADEGEERVRALIVELLSEAGGGSR